MALSSATLLSHLKKKPTVIFSLSLLLFLLSFLFLPSEPSLPFSRISTSDLSKVEPSVTGTGTGLPPPPLPADLDQTDVPPPSLDADLDPKEADDEKVESVGNGVEAPPPDPDPDPDPVEVETGGSGVEAASPDPVEVEMGGSGVEAPPPDPDPDGSGVSVEGRRRMCDLYQGRWVMDEEGRYPLYAAGSCPYVDDAYTCQENGRTDVDYMKWRWKPNDCHLPRFNATDFLERLRGKHLMLVGDSMNRNQFESMLCLLQEALPDKRRMYETRGYKITKGRGYFIFLFKDYKCTVEFVRSHFLVREGTRINKQGNSNPTLAIDRIDKSANRWKKADILVFNTGHWWTHGKTARGKNYYVEGGVIYPQFDAIEAFRRALRTWGRWIDNNMNKKSLIFYRGYSAAHFRGGDWDSGGSCSGETEPAVSGAIIDSYPLKMKIVEDVIDKMKVPVVLLNVTKLTNFRKDAHPSIYGMLRKPGQKVSKRKQDCSHWCLPGVPDSWNELIYATLVLQQPHKA